MNTFFKVVKSRFQQSRIIKIFNHIFPLCPNGGHRLKGKLHTNINDKKFCEHPDCIKANIIDLVNVDCLEHCIKKFTCARTFGEMPCDHAREAYVRKMNSFHK